jgi:MFS family permease
MLVLFAASYGFFAGGFSAVWAGMMKEVKRENPEAGMGSLMGVFAAGRGVGAVVSGPVSEALVERWRGRVGGGGGGGFGYGYGTEYGALIVFTGVSAFLGVVCFGVTRKKSEISSL